MRTSRVLLAVCAAVTFLAGTAGAWYPMGVQVELATSTS
jgi:hypothetical protein